MIIANSLLWFVRFLKQLFFMQNGTCRHIPTCSQFAHQAILELPIHRAIARIIYRICTCHPWGRHGYDPVHPISSEEQINE